MTLCDSREGEERLRTVVHNMPAMMIAFGEDGTIIAWNQECERVTGYSAAEIVGNEQAIERLWPDADYRNRMIREWFSQRYDYRDWEWQVACKDGVIKTVSWSNISEQCPIPGWATWIVGIDITGRKQAEIELNRRLAEIETLYAIGQLVSSNLQIDQVTELIAEHMGRLVNAARCVICDWDADSDTLAVKAEYRRSDLAGVDGTPAPPGVVQAVSESAPAAAAIRERRPLLAELERPDGTAGERRVAVVPIVARDRVVGLSQVYQAEGDPPLGEHDLRLLQMLADQAAVAIDNARLFSKVRASEAAMRDLSVRLLSVQEQERRHIAQELHDELGQLLTAIKINIDLAKRKMTREGDAPLRQRLDEASQLTDDVLTSVRTMTVELRPALLDEMGIVPALRWYLKRFSHRTGVETELDAGETGVRLLPEIETAIYRIVQEALTNVARHAHASRVCVGLAYQNGDVIVSVRDDGRGFDLAAWAESQNAHQTLGLTGIQERAMLLDGRAALDSAPGKGTRVEATLPARFCEEGADGWH